MKNSFLTAILVFINPEFSNLCLKNIYLIIYPANINQSKVSPSKISPSKIILSKINT